MFEWLSTHRADISAIIILLLVAAFATSIYFGLKESHARRNDEVFGDPERTRGGWHWAVTGLSALMLVWFFFSWGMARAYFPSAANELCQVGKISEALSPITARLPIGSRYYKSTTLVVRNSAQIDGLETGLPQQVFDQTEQRTLRNVIGQTRSIIAILSNPAQQDPKTAADLAMVADDLNQLADRLRSGYDGLVPTAEALEQPRWGVESTEIPLLPITARGVLFDDVSVEVKSVAERFLKLRNFPPEAMGLIEKTMTEIVALKDAANNDNSWGESEKAERVKYIKAVERIFRRLDDGIIFPADALQDVNQGVENLFDAVGDAKGGLGVVEALFFPGEGVVKSRTICIEQGSARWLPKPTDVVAKFAKLANPDVENGGGYKGTTLLWVKWLPISDVVGFLIPDMVVDALPGSYGTHDSDGSFMPTYKDRLLALAQGEVYLGSIPMLDGHIWDHYSV